MPHLQRSRGRLGTEWGRTSLGISKIHSDTNGCEREKPLIFKGFGDWLGLSPIPQLNVC